MGNKLYVGNLPLSATELNLSSMFAACGAVQSVVLITDRDTGRSKGFGFVEMGSEAEARAAINSFNDADFGGQPMKVAEAESKQKPGANRHRGFRNGNRW